MESPKPSPQLSKRVKYDVADETTDGELHYPVSTGEYGQDVHDYPEYIDLTDAEADEGAFPNLESEAIAAILGDEKDDSFDADENDEDDRTETVNLSSGEYRH